MPLSHIGIPVSDLARSRAFYEAALAPLEMGVTMEFEQAVGFGARGDSGLFWIGAGENDKVGAGLHVAFEADSRARVDAFHAAALKAGGTDNGSPGPRPNYGPNYYAAFVYDPDGANIEAVYDKPA
jgi:catechol 2,3-dioxygenase-like lactoylglutathione lyase family enzyme